MSPPRGILFYGKPGTGKTLLAKGIANYTNYHFMPISISDIMSEYVGESEKILHEIFQTARRCQYTLFIIIIVITILDLAFYSLMNFKQFLVKKMKIVEV